MKNLNYKTTIAAISTPFGRGGIAVIRISGDNAVSVAEKIFKPKNKSNLCSAVAGKFIRGDIIHENDIIDDGMAVVFHAPHSYTGEDTVELHCHGGIVLAQTVLEAAFDSGAEAAEAGEFTKRAFINGKLGLSQAEAIIELIDAENREKLKLSAAQARGVLSRKTEEIYNSVKNLVSSTYVYIDFPDEDLADVTPDEMKDRLNSILFEIDRLIATYHTGRSIMNGIPSVIVGKPNTGKSSLLNAMLGEQRALVTEIAGTTRDTIEETLTIGRVTLRLCDTAGIRELSETAEYDRNSNIIESLGINRTYQKLSEAELALVLFDSSMHLSEEDEAVISYINESFSGSSIAVLNKSDLSYVLSDDELRKITESFEHTIKISTKTECGLQDLYKEIENIFIDGDIDYASEAVITNARQYSALKNARECISAAYEALLNSMTPDIAGLDLERAMIYLSELDGRQVTEDIVNDIFHRFCVGK